jgi:hypothetical protein
MLHVAFLALLTGLAAPERPSARVEVLEGRATLAGPSGVRELKPGTRSVEEAGRAYLEVPPLTRVSIRWRATASLLVRGPATLEWGPGTGRNLLEWRLLSQTETHLEVRRGPVRAELPGGWRATLESGAAFLRHTPGGGLELHHDAGQPLLLAAAHEPDRVRPPRVVLAGARLHLGALRSEPELLPGSRSRLLEPYGRSEDLAAGPQQPMGPWTGFSWPWRIQAVEARVETHRIPPTPPPGGRPPGRISRPRPVSEARTEALPEPRTVPPPQAEPENVVAPVATSEPVSVESFEAAPAEPPEVGPELPGEPDARRRELSPEVLQRLWTASAVTVFFGSSPAAPRPEPVRIRRHGQLRLTPYGVRWKKPR